MEDGHIREPVWIPERREDPVPRVVLERNIPNGAVLKQQAELVLADHGYALMTQAGRVLDMP